MLKNELIAKLDDRSAVIGVIGLGYVGLPLILRYAEIGYTTIGLDIDEKKTDLLTEGQSYIKHISANRVRAASESRA